MNKKLIKGLSLLALLGILTGCKPLFGSNTSDSVNNSSNAPETSENKPTSESKPSSSSQTSTSEDVLTSQDDSSSSEEDKPTRPDGPTLNEHGLAINPQDGTILHAFNWHLNNIKDALPDIKKAGYSAVQTSPMQPQKDIYINGHWSNQWWKLYQPLGFSVATKNHSIGTKTDLINLCKEADKYGIKIIVDVVANHLANKNGNDVNPAIKEYEPEIYDKNLFHPFSIGSTNDLTTKNVVQGHLSGLPDLKTENEIVQDAVLDLLKEYVDCGVDGFRFDAAKHIETPYDGEYASNFWPHVLNGASEYAKAKETDLYYYGEILKTPGDTRNFAYYTDMMSITDSEASHKILNAVTNNDFSSLENSDIYSNNVAANKAILWGESHDTYSNPNGISKKLDQKTVNKAYAIAASFNDAASLYLARPSNDSKLGEAKTFDWKNNEIEAVNKMHNQFINSDEVTYSIENIFVNIKQKDCKTGVILINGNENNKFNITTGGIKDGIYTDKISMKQVMVNNGIISGTFDNSGIMVFDAEPGEYLPTISVSNNGSEPITKPIDVKISVKNADSAYYVLNDNKPVNFKDTCIVKVGVNESTKLKVVASKNGKEISKTYIYTKVELNDLDIICNNIPDKYLNSNNEIYAWVWKQGQDGRWVNGTLKDHSFKFRKTKNDTHFIIVIMKPNSAPDWSNKIVQTSDIEIANKQIFDLQNMIWKQ